MFRANWTFFYAPVVMNDIPYLVMSLILILQTKNQTFFSCLTFFIKWASFWMFLVFKICPNLEIDHLRMLITPRWSFTSTSKHPQEKFTRVSRTIKHSVSKENIKFLVPLRSRNSRQITSVNIFYLKHLINIVESSI